MPATLGSYPIWRTFPVWFQLESFQALSITPTLSLPPRTNLLEVQEEL